MRFNPLAVIFWAALALGFHIFGGDWTVGLFIGLMISIVVGIFESGKN